MFRRLREPGVSVGIAIDGQPHRAAPGDMVSAVLLASGVETFRVTARNGARRGPYCCMGVCFDCLVTIDGVPNRQACLVPVAEGMTVDTGLGPPDLAPAGST